MNVNTYLFLFVRPKAACYCTSQSPQDPQKEQPQPLHGLKLVIKEEVLPATDQPQFPSLELLAGRGS